MSKREAIGLIKSAKKENKSALDLSRKNLKNEDLGEIIDQIKELRNLQILDLSNNRFTSIPQGLCELTRLKSLLLNGNQLSSLPRDIRNLTNLGVLILAANNFTNLPEELGELTNLRVLNLASNRLRDLPPSLARIYSNLRIMNLRDNPLTQETMNWLAYTFRGRASYNMAAHDFLNNPKDVLKAIYPEKSQHSIDSVYQGIQGLSLGNFTLGGEQKSAKEVLKEFLSKMPLLDLNTEKIYIPTAKYLLDKALKSSHEDSRKHTITAIATSLGDCATPVKDFLMQAFIGMERKKGGGPSQEALNVLSQLAVGHKINKELDKELSKKPEEKIEQVKGLVNAIFLETAENNNYNKVKIKGNRTRLPSTTVYIDFAFMQVTDEVAREFPRLFCKMGSDGKPIKLDQKHYELAPEKLKAVVELYGHQQGFPTERGGLVEKFERQLQEAVIKHGPSLLTEHFEKTDVKTLMAYDRHKDNMMLMLVKTEDDKIEQMADKHLVDMVAEIKELENKYNPKKKEKKNLSKFTQPSNRRDRTPPRDDRGGSSSEKRQRRHSPTTSQRQRGHRR